MNHQQMDEYFSPYDLYVSPLGNDQWSGRLDKPTEDGTDGPLATLGKARDLLRELKQTAQFSGPVTVWLRGGCYPLTEPLIFGPDDSGPVTYAAYPGEQATLDGGRRLENWRVERLGARDMWVAEIPEVAAGCWYFRQLFVNGRRRSRARLPKVGPQPHQRQFYQMESVPGLTPASTVTDGSDVFRCMPGDFQNWRNIQDVEVVVLHFWTDERMPVLSFDEKTRLVKSSRRSFFRLTATGDDDAEKSLARYYIDNVFEALSEPGEWYLDRSTGKLYYLPMPGERLAEARIFAPYATQLLKLVGDPDTGRYVENIRFEGLTLQHTDWYQPPGGLDPAMEHASPFPPADYTTAPQAATHVPGAIYLSGARYCAIENCTIQHIGWYGIEIADGCLGNRIVGNEIGDLGAGGIKLNGASARGPRVRRSGNHRITDNHIHSGGRVFHSAIGVLLRHTFGNDVSHNHIHDLYYSGISCGWVWGFAENVARNNRLEKNHIHDLGHGWLSDMGGIYTLGVQPGTVIRGNLIHDVEAAHYGGWAIYPDEGSSHIVIEKNLCYRTTQHLFHQHYGRENIVRNNIFAFGSISQIALSRIAPKEGEALSEIEGTKAFTFERNIVITKDQPIFQGGYAADIRKNCLLSDLNLFWSHSGQPLTIRAGNHPQETPALTWDEWQTSGQDHHSLVADPGFRNISEDDFTLSHDSPALMLGFQPLDMSDVGPRPKG